MLIQRCTIIPVVWLLYLTLPYYGSPRYHPLAFSFTFKHPVITHHSLPTNSFSRYSSVDDDCSRRRGMLHLASNEPETEDDDNSRIHGYTHSDLQQMGYNTFQSKFTYPLDSWQCEAGGGIALGWNVIVTAPTGAGKTAVGIMALHQVFDNNTRRNNQGSSLMLEEGTAIYTTPLKALSNQKFVELQQTFGSNHVGLSTGDMCIQRGAIITVMTTEVYRNMCWKSSPDSSMTSHEDEEKDGTTAPFCNSMVVLDEFHYMGLVGRGTVWEESVITSPKSTQLIALSATLSNAYDIAQWMERVTGRPTLLVDVAHETRPVPLRYYFATTQGILPLFRDVDAGPGAPHGLLGLRGDYGTIQKKKMTKKPASGHYTNKGFAQTNKSKVKSPVMDDDTEESLPKGLQLHPALARIEQQRMDKIHRIMARKVLVNRWERVVGTPKQQARDEGHDSSRMNNNKGRKNTLKSQDFNPQKMSREERKERDQILRQEMKKAVPSISFLVDRLQHMDLLPAIFFIFSRVGCDNAAEAVCQSMRRRGTLKQQGQDIMGGNNDEGLNIHGGKTVTKKHERKHHDGKVDEPHHKTTTTRHRGNHFGDETKSVSDGTIKDKDGRVFRKQSNYISEDMMSSIMEGNMSYTENNVGSLDEDRLHMYSQCGLLGTQEVAQVVKRVRGFNEENPEIKFDDETVDRFYYGVASHHAGQLPAHKAFVESLFRAQLIKVVFATETLAAGINMPARTTVICSLAKRGDNQNINLLETSSLLQMAGRAGRRGMDTDGTCIIVATPFEGPDSAIDILTDELKPVVSQFTPSYSLVVNLIARGNGTLDVARTLVQSSFAYFEKEGSEKRIESAREAYGDDFEQFVQTASHEKFLDTLKDSVTRILDSGVLNGKQRWMHERVLNVLSDKALLKKESKAYLSLSRIYDIENNTLKALQREAVEMAKNGRELVNVEDFNIGETYLDDEIITQKSRVAKSHQVLFEHIFTVMAIVSNYLMTDDFQSNESLRVALNLARKGDGARDILSPVDPLELTTFVKTAVSDNRKRRKQDALGISIGISSPTLMDSFGHVESFPDNAWKDTIALTKVLKTYGCLVDVRDELETKENYRITTGGNLLIELGLENSLWCIVALGGAWDVVGSSVGAYDDRQNRWKSAEDNTENQHDIEGGLVPVPQREAASLVSCLRDLDPSEMAGYVSCLVADDIRGSPSILSSFDSLSPNQKVAIQQAFLALDRLEEIQRQNQVDMLSGRVQLELGACQVITAWAAGCSWADALDLSGLSPGDLIRTLHRALDALRQIASLTYNPVRPLTKIQTEAFGIHPEILKLCREAAFAMDRYPVKDTLLSFEEDSESETMIEEEGEDENK